MSEPDYLDSDKYIEQYLEIAKQKFEEGNKAVLTDGDASMPAD